MKKVIVIIMVVVLMGGGLGAGVLWVLRQNTGVRLLSRARVALQAKNYPKAAEAAEQYIAQVPGDWRGHQTRGEALLRLAKYEDARESFQEASRLNEKEAGPILGLASTYSFAAKRSMSQQEGSSPIKAMKLALDRFAQANAVVLGAENLGETEALDLKERLGRDYQSISSAWFKIGERLDEEAKRYQDVNSTFIADAKREESAEAMKQSRETVRKAIESLLEVVTQDASRPQAASTLVELCLEYEDLKSLEIARKAILSLENPPAIAAMQLTVYELKSVVVLSRQKQREKLVEVCDKLDDLLKANPDELQLKLTRADTALMLEDYDTAERICNEILKDNKRQSRARLILGQVQMGKKEFAKAVKTLGDLRTDYDRFVHAHYFFAVASAALGNTQDATYAMRYIVSTLDPTHPGARAYLAETLMRSGYFDEAVIDSEAYYQAYPGTPGALSLFVRAALGLDRPRTKLVEETLKKAWAEHALNADGTEHHNSAEMMAVIAHGYDRLGNNNLAQQIYTRAAMCKPVNLAGRLAVVRALRHIGRSPEAEHILLDELKNNPGVARVHYELGQLYAATNRQPQAIDQLQTTTRLNPHKGNYLLSLAQLWFDIGDLSRCLGVLEKMDPTDEEAKLLNLRIKLLRGEKVPVEQVVKQIGRTRQAGLALAASYLASGEAQWCVNVCKDALKSTPDDRALRFMLGQALLVLGPENEKECLTNWSQVLANAPHQLPLYFSIAGVLATKNTPDQVAEYLSRIKDSRPDMVSLAMGWLYTRQKNFPEAVKAYAKVAADSRAPMFIRQRARLLQAKTMASAGQLDEALKQLDQLTADASQMRAAMEAKAEVLVWAGRKSDALSVMMRLGRIVADDEDGPAVRRVVQLMMSIGQFEEAAVLCHRLRAFLPDDARSCLLLSGVLQAMGRQAEMIPLLEKAIAMQSGNFETYVVLADTLDDLGKPREALKALARMQNTGPAGEARALLEQGKLLARWGLSQRAGECFRQFSRQNYGDNPVLKLALGKALARLGATAEARAILDEKNIPRHSAQYVPAQLALIALADSEEQKLVILNSLAKAKPEDTGILEYRMQVMIRLGKGKEALDVFHAFMESDRKPNAAQAMLHRLALQAMMDDNDQSSAARLAMDFSKATGAPRWKLVGALLSLDDKDATAAATLPDVKQAALYDALLGLIIAARGNDALAAARWADRVEQINNDGAKSGKQTLPPGHRLLAVLLANSPTFGQAELDKLIGLTGFGQEAARELVQRRADSGAREELIKLLKATVAIDLGLVELGRNWAMEVLTARPQSQWAASIVMQSRPNKTTRRKITDILQPVDCGLALRIRGSLFRDDGQYDRAAELYGRAAKAYGGHPRFVLFQAVATENAGDQPGALSLYEQVWHATQSPQAANGAAFLISQLYPNDQAKLGRALAMSEVAVSAGASDPIFLDTRGWILLLLGKIDRARVDLRRAVRGMPDSPMMHYHVGIVEGRGGDHELAKWHYEAAISSAAKAQAAGTMSLSAGKAAKLAEAALTKLPPPASK